MSNRQAASKWGLWGAACGAALQAVLHFAHLYGADPTYPLRWRLADAVASVFCPHTEALLTLPAGYAIPFFAVCYGTAAAVGAIVAIASLAVVRAFSRRTRLRD